VPAGLFAVGLVAIRLAVAGLAAMGLAARGLVVIEGREVEGLMPEGAGAGDGVPVTGGVARGSFWAAGVFLVEVLGVGDGDRDCRPNSGIRRCWLKFRKLSDSW